MSKPNVYKADIDTLRSMSGVNIREARQARQQYFQEMRDSGRIITAQNVKNASAADALDFKKPVRKVDDK